jgi:hypothetical protein
MNKQIIAVDALVTPKSRIIHDDTRLYRDEEGANLGHGEL